MGPTRRWSVYPICTLKIPEEGGNVKALPGGEESWRVWSGPIPPEESGAGGWGGLPIWAGRAGERKQGCLRDNRQIAGGGEGVHRLLPRSRRRPPRARASISFSPGMTTTRARLWR